MTSFRVEDDATDQRREIALAHLARSIPDPELRARLTPDFPIGCKRLLLSNDYLPIFNRPTVDLVTSAIERVTPTGVTTHDGVHHPLDVLILATGFRAADYLSAIDVYGTGGRRLADQWRDGAEAHLGLTVSGFPNLFTLYGPNTNQGGNSIIFILESQVHYVMAAVKRLSRRRGALEVDPAVQSAYNRRLQAAMAGTVWDGGCTNYFRGSAGRITTQYPYPARRYWAQTRRLKRRDYSFTPTAADTATAAPVTSSA
jgi:cation diffusion facilitator CzcD-associated flavoprotein CzcO